MSDWNLQRIRYFVEVTEAPSLSEAARRIGISQPALTGSIRKLEKELGFLLFDRADGFRLTALGCEMLSRSRTVLSRIGDLTREVELLKAGDAGEVRVACGPTIADGLMGTALAGLLRNHPDLKCSVEVGSPGEMLPMLRERKVDLFVAEITLFDQDADLEIEALPKQEIVLFCRAGHPLAGRRRVSPEEFFRFPTFASALPPWAQAWITKHRHEDQHPHALNLECSHHELIKRVVMGSDGVSGAPREVVANELDDGRLAEIDLVADSMFNQPGIVRLRGNLLTPAAAQLIDEVQKAAAK